ncbi:ester cyclase [Kribbella sp. NPDC026611]|uniref:ester cyclase n=1 Tax=Kribbella sp. NPDC026611 TaxID=3154911 RepID=UPI0033C7AA28
MNDFYRRYIGRCNEHRFHDLSEFVEPDVVVNGEQHGFQRYAEGLQEVVDKFPDFHWTVEQVLADGQWLAVRLTDTGTTSEGRAVTTREFAMYHVPDGRIAAVWGDLDHDAL